MAWIREIEEHEADGEIGELYGRLREERGKVSNILKVHSLNPGALQRHLDLYMHLLFGRSGLSRAERESIAVAVSGANRCDYCVNHHAEALRRYVKDEAQIDAIARGVEGSEAGLDARVRAVTDYARRLTTAPGDVTEADVAALRSAGLTDEDILDANLVVAYFNFVNRIALGLGVDFTPEEMTGYKV